MQHWAGLFLLIRLALVAALSSLCTPMYGRVSHRIGVYEFRIGHFSVSDGAGSGAVGLGWWSCAGTGGVRMGIPRG